MAAGRRRELEREFKGRVRFERRTFLLMPQKGQRPAYDDYVIAHRVRAAQMLPELKFAIPRSGAKYPRSSWPAQLFALRVEEVAPDRLAAVEDALFGAMFRELRDISDPDVLRECARASGVAEGQVEAALGNEALAARAVREHQEAEDLGINGIPALALPGLDPITGAVAVEDYRRAVEQSLQTLQGLPGAQGAKSPEA